jgi:hypothetical protein
MKPLILLSLSLFAISAAAQPPSPTPPIEKSSVIRALPVLDEQVRVRRLTAFTLLKTLSDEVKSYNEPVLRGTVQARIAEILWDSDPNEARDLFRRAWESSETIKPTPKTDGTGFIGPGSISSNDRARVQLRSEILRLVARRDPKLVEEFLGKDARKLSIDLGSDKPLTRVPSEAELKERVRLASQLLEENQLANALQIAAPAFRHLNENLILFLSSLRDRDPNTADKLFADLLRSSRQDPDADANTVSLLSSYAFTPSVFIKVSKSGYPSGFTYEPKPQPNLSEALRRQFFNVSTPILLRPFAELDQTSAGRLGTLYISRRLLPLFQQYAPDLAPALSAQITALGPDSRQLNDEEVRLQNRGVSGPETSEDLDAQLSQTLEQAKTAEQRDRAYALAAVRASDRGDQKALEFAWKIQHEETRKGVTNLVEFNLVQANLQKKQLEEGLRLARKSSLTPIQRARVFTRAASLVIKTDSTRALELLNEAIKDAERSSDTERAYLFTAIVEQLSMVDRVRSWELLNEVIKAANNTNFTGESGQFSMESGGNFSIRLGIELASKDSLTNSVEMLARDDFFQAINVAKTFRNDAPRAIATIAIARSVLRPTPNIQK